jgi:hypothetical protein
MGVRARALSRYSASGQRFPTLRSLNSNPGAKKVHGYPKWPTPKAITFFSKGVFDRIFRSSICRPAQMPKRNRASTLNILPSMRSPPNRLSWHNKVYFQQLAARLKWPYISDVKAWIVCSLGHFGWLKPSSL